MATAELAVALPAVVVVLAVSLFAFGLAADELRCIDAARAGARAAARGDATSEVAATARRMAPRGSEVSVAVGGDAVRVGVRAPRRSPAFLPLDLRPSADATAALEESLP